MYYADDGRLVIVGEGAIDYLSITTYDGGQDYVISEILRQEYPEMYEKTVINKSYVGIKYAEYVVLAQGMQQKMPHFLLIATGYNSDKILRHMLTDERIDLSKWKVTRIDIQVTLKKKARRTKLITLGMNLEAGKYGDVSNRRKVSVRYQGSETGDTIYIGSPKSEKMRRIYDKFLTDMAGEVIQMERYEIQYRDRTAQSVVNRMIKEGAIEISRVIQKIIKGDMSTLPEKFVEKLSVHRWQPNTKAIIINRAGAPSKTSNTTKWVRQIRYALLRACSQEGINGIESRKALLEALVCAISDDYLEDWSQWRLLSPYGAIWTVAGEEYTSD